jgi:sec-independent protein translocase protein TatC
MIKAFIEIKNRIILLVSTALSAFLIAYYYKTFILILIIVSNSRLSNDILNYFIFTSITELFSIYLTLCFFLSSQILYYTILYHIICFLSSGLYKIEYNNLKFIFSLIILLGIVSIYFFYKILIPTLSDFFLSFQNYSLKTISFYFEAKIYDYLIFYKEIYLSCFFSFQSCAVLILLSNFVSNDLGLLKPLRKFFYIILLLFSTAVTPPEIFSQFFLFINLVFGFETLIFLNLFKKIYFNSVNN